MIRVHHLLVCLSVSLSINLHIFDFNSRTIGLYTVLNHIGRKHCWEKIKGIILSKRKDTKFSKGNEREIAKVPLLKPPVSRQTLFCDGGNFSAHILTLVRQIKLTPSTWNMFCIFALKYFLRILHVSNILWQTNSRLKILITFVKFSPFENNSTLKRHDINYLTNFHIGLYTQNYIQ